MPKILQSGKIPMRTPADTQPRAVGWEAIERQAASPSMFERADAVIQASVRLELAVKDRWGGTREYRGYEQNDYLTQPALAVLAAAFSAKLDAGELDQIRGPRNRYAHDGEYPSVDSASALVETAKALEARIQTECQYCDAAWSLSCARVKKRSCPYAIRTCSSCAETRLHRCSNCPALSCIDCRGETCVRCHPVRTV